MVANAVGAARADAPVLRVRGLSARFGPVVALHDVDLDLRPGEIVGLAGDNGAGKSTLLRCLCADVTPERGQIWLDGRSLPRIPSAQRHARIGVVWQHVVLSDNLDVAANLTLGKERRRLLMSESARHAHARATLEGLGLLLADTTREASALTAGERQLLAIARAVSPAPQLLLLDEPTAVLNRADSLRVEQVIRRLRDGGTSILLVSHDMDELFRLADRIVVLRRGRSVAVVTPADSHPDELFALMAGHDVATVARRQLGRLHALASRLNTPDGRDDATGTSAELSLILSTLGMALGAGQVSMHVLDDEALHCVASVGLPVAVERAWHTVSAYATDNPLAEAVADNVLIVMSEAHARMRPDTEADVYARVLDGAGVHECWAVPVATGSHLRAVIGVFRTQAGAPGRDELDLITLYAGYAAAALERERLLAELTARNTVLETIRAVLQTLAGPGSLAEGLQAVLRMLCDALHADDIGLYVRGGDDRQVTCRASAAAQGHRPRPSRLAPAATASLNAFGDDGRVHVLALASGGSRLSLRLAETSVLVAEWSGHLVDSDERVLLEDASHSIHLALERERTELAHREVAALLRTRELQREFLARLSHELRTPLTAIHGYASSLLQTDVTWDDASRHRFLSRIAGESDRLGRLVADLLDFSLIESGMLRLRPDWVDLSLVLDAAVACLAPPAAAAVHVRRDGDMPVIWADHDRVEQMLVNLMDNAVRHNPPGTRVQVDLRADGADGVTIEVSDDGVGMLSTDAAEQGRHPAQRSATGGAGLGLLITRGIVDAHHGTMRREPAHPGTRYIVRLPVEPAPVTEESQDA